MRRPPADEVPPPRLTGLAGAIDRSLARARELAREDLGEQLVAAQSARGLRPVGGFEHEAWPPAGVALLRTDRHEPGLREHTQMRAHRVDVQADGVRELTRVPRLLARPQRLEDPRPGRVGEGPMEVCVSLHTLILDHRDGKKQQLR